MDLEAIRTEIEKIDNCTSGKSPKAEKAYLNKVIKEFIEEFGVPHKFDMSDEAMFYNYALYQYQFLNNNF